MLTRCNGQPAGPMSVYTCMQATHQHSKRTAHPRDCKFSQAVQRSDDIHMKQRSEHVRAHVAGVTVPWTLIPDALGTQVEPYAPAQRHLCVEEMNECPSMRLRT